MNRGHVHNTFHRYEDVIRISVIVLAALAIYYPVFFADYVYTDEAPQLWLARKGVNLTSIPQGRYLTYRLFTFLFSHIGTIAQLKYARIFSLGGWIVCIPLWYFIIKKIVLAYGLPKPLIWLLPVYLISLPAFTISVAWAACLELFIANTCGLLSGYLLYLVLRRTSAGWLDLVALIACAFFAMIALFTYQHGFGCFLIPFALRFSSKKQPDRLVYGSITGMIGLYATYYVIFRLNIAVWQMPADGRSQFVFEPMRKLAFFVVRPLQNAFHFGVLLPENSAVGWIMAAVVIAVWLYKNQSIQSKVHTVQYFFVWMLFFMLTVLPSLVVHENYASNRTLLALQICVMIAVATTVLSSINTTWQRNVVATTVSLFFLLNAAYNYRVEFLAPVAREFAVARQVITKNMSAAVDTVYCIQPAENAFEVKYGTVPSMDEFGVPSTAKSWVPSALIRQLVFERTGNRSRAERLQIINVTNTWPSRAAQKNNVLIVDMHAPF